MKLDFSQSWLMALGDILANGERVAPRGQMTKEILQRTLVVDMRKPVLNVPERQLSYKFMAAEAYWILSGDNKVSTIAPYNKMISQFSDDEEIFFGAYGPKIDAQIEYVVNKLRIDPDTRQAGLTIWRENPPPTKDVPCTVAIFFNIRNGKLNASVYMRSSDVWLGVPYDVFNFSMLAHMVCCFLNSNHDNEPTVPGTLYLTAASSHLYERNWDEAHHCLARGTILEQPETPEVLYQNGEKFTEWLKQLRDTKPGDSFLRWWENN